MNKTIMDKKKRRKVLAKKILFISFKGGVGVSTFCYGLARTLAERGERTLIVDGDDRCASLLTICGCDNAQVYTLADVERGACRPKQAILQHPKERNLYIMPSLGCKNRTVADRAVKEVENLFDFVLCDEIAGSCCREAAVVCEPYAPSLKCADYTLNYLNDQKVSDIGLVVNKMNGGMVFDGDVLTPQEIASLLHVRLRAAIPEDLGLQIGKIKKTTKDAFAAAADNFSGRKAVVSNLIKPYYGINGYFRRKMRNGL